jgi:hypothetical protein
MRGVRERIKRIVNLGGILLEHVGMIIFAVEEFIESPQEKGFTQSI